MDALSVPPQRLARRSRIQTCAVPRNDERRGSRAWITILQQQVLREVLQVFLLTLCVTTGLMILVGVVQQLIAMGATAGLLLKLLPYFVPVMLPFVIPAALLFAVIIVYGRMGADSEMTAAKAAGINVLSLLMPSFVLGAELALATFVLTDRAVPWAARQIQGAVVTYAGDLLVQQLDARGHIDNGPGGMQITVAGMDGTRMIRPRIRLPFPGGREYSVWAAAARFEVDREQAAVLLHVENAAVDVSRASGAASDHAFISGEQTIPLPYAAGDVRPKSHHLTRGELRRGIRAQEQAIRKRLQELGRAGAMETAAVTPNADWQLQEATRVYRNLRTELHSRYALAYGSFGFALFGSALAALQASGRMLTNILFCFMPVVGAYSTVFLGMAALC
jgi:hypothetical protein